ncbi:nitroreductase family protein [Paenibacillus phocaensis]|uniref:nitroreductase family protein n=1 Tax=Paenibacillus phocaensis TaxID=1776378 RepID=UPI0003A52909|nr:nitroreductase family protein [Paenibacillus phocaensis]
MMNFSQTIRERRTIRKFNTSPVSRELVASLINEAASLYESEGTPRWRCIYAGTPESRERLADYMMAKMLDSKLGKLIPAKMIAKRVTDIPAHLLVVAESGADQRESDENYAAACSIMQTLQLLAWERGLGVLWDTEPFVQSESFLASIGVREGERFVGTLHLGYFDKAPKGRKRTPAEQKWTVLHGGGELPGRLTDAAALSESSILDTLNTAVWAPNDGMREPWRFIFVTGGEEAGGNAEVPLPGSGQAHLLVVTKEESDPHKREEDYAAVCCLIQNFELLAKSKPWGVRRTRPEWIYDPKPCRLYGVEPGERIAAVLELGVENAQPPANFAAPRVNWFEL